MYNLCSPWFVYSIEYKKEILYPILQSVARRLNQTELYEGLVSDDEPVVIPRGASEKEIKMRQVRTAKHTCCDLSIYSLCISLISIWILGAFILIKESNNNNNETVFIWHLAHCKASKAPLKRYALGAVQVHPPLLYIYIYCELVCVMYIVGEAAGDAGMHDDQWRAQENLTGTEPCEGGEVSGGECPAHRPVEETCEYTGS